VTFAPAPLVSLRSYLIREIPISGAKVGIVGDTDHANKGTSYHLGKSSLRWDAYSRQTARDKKGLTEAASAIDIGNHKGLEGLSNWLVKQCQRNALGTRDVREVIYAGRYKGGLAVLRYDRERGVGSAPRPGEADNSHLTHTHVSFYRDSESRDKIVIFKPFYEPEDEMDLFNAGQLLRRLPAGTDVFDEPGGTKTGDLGDGTAASVVFRVVAQDKTGTWWLIDGGGQGKRMGWVKAV
jgi:hypothetical protein